MPAQAFRMQLKPGAIVEYKKRHDEIWPELAGLLRQAGIYEYSIFLDEVTLSLFAVMKLRTDNLLDALPGHPLMQRWWDYMAPLMEVEPGNKPREWSMTPMFHML